MVARTYAALIALGFLNGAALAANDGAPLKQNPPPPAGLFQGTVEEQAACAPDATRYCLNAIPDSLRVLACLQKNRRHIRKACLHVLESHGM